MITRRAFIGTAMASLPLARGLHGDRAVAEEIGRYVLATGGAEATAYPVGAAIASLVNTKLAAQHKIGMDAVTTAGAGENVARMRESAAQFAILQGFYGYYAWNGLGHLKDSGPLTELRSVSMLWRNVEQLVIASRYAESGSVADLVNLRGKTLALGKEGSGALVSNRYLLDKLGFDIDADFQLSFSDYGASARALQQGQIDGMGVSSGIPTAAVTDVFGAMGSDAVLLEFTEEQAQAADGGLVLWSPYTIPAGTYAGLARDIDTIAQPSFLAVRADVDEEAVYLVTQLIYQNLPFLEAIHPATRSLKFEDAILGLTVPLHPGAARYYREAGLKVPDRLVAGE